MPTTTRKRKCKEDGDVESESRIDDLNDTLLELIFTRLSPWKSLVISRCVSKRWNSIISNPDFTRRLYPQSFPFTLFSDTRCLVTEHPYFQKHNFPNDFIIPTSHRFVGSTNDLVVAYHHINSQIGEYYVANMVTKQYIVVPIPLATPIDEYRNYKVGIAGFVDGVSTVNVSHCNNHNHNHGFRIVHIHDVPEKSIVQIYSSETDQWKTYSFDCHIQGYVPPITWNNKIHWLNYYNSEIVVIDPFKIDNEVPRVVNLPKKIRGNHSSSLSLCQNRLRIAQFEDPWSNWENQRIELWEIENYNDADDNLGSNYKAKVKLVIDYELEGPIPMMIDKLYKPIRYRKIVCCHPNDPQVVYFYYDGILVYCNVVEKNCKLICSRFFYPAVLVSVHSP